MNNSKLKEKLAEGFVKTKVYYDNEDFQKMFKPGDWVVLGYCRASWDDDKPSVMDGRNIQFIWAIRLVNIPFDFKEIIHKYEYVILFDCYRSDTFLHLKNNASVSNAQHWFRPITIFEKLAIINLYSNKLL